MSAVHPKNWHPKTKATGAAGAITVLAVWIAGQLGVEVPNDVAAALAALLATAAAWWRS